MVATALSGCNIFSDIVSYRLKMLDLETANADKSNLEISQKVLKYLSKSDAKGLKTLFCEKTQNLADTNNQILSAFDFFKGKVISFNENVMGYEGDSTEYGIKTLLERSWTVEKIVTDKGGRYEINIFQYVIYKEDENREGITKIVISNSKGAESVIGYSWPEHIDDANEMSWKIVDIFEKKDLKALKNMFCAKTLKLDGIDKQIQLALDFFEGKPTNGVIGKVDGQDISDGSHDYNISVIDHETVKNSLPTSTSIEVLINNIETDIGKVYEIKYFAYLLCIDKKNIEGISQMIISSNDGKKQIIGKKIK